MSWFKKKTYPEYWNAYSTHFKSKQNIELKSVRFVVFDTETTGLDTKNDRILSIGTIAVFENITLLALKLIEVPHNELASLA